MRYFSPLKVLIVEDEGMIALELEATIEDEGHNVVGWATSAEEAIEMFDATRPDLVFLDVHLVGEASGVDVARYLHERHETKFVFLTANPDLIDRDFLGGIGILAKPFSNTKLISTIRYLHQGVFDPPPAMTLPFGFILGPAYSASWV